MITQTKKAAKIVALTLGVALAFTACSGAPTTEAPESTDTGTAADYYPLTVTDMAGNEVTIESVDSVGVFQNQAFGVLESWGVEPTVAPRSLMSDNNSWASDESILDSGTHREPDFEQVVVAAPEVIINGGRYLSHADGLKAAAPEAAYIDMTNDELSNAEYVVQSVTLLGEIFNEQEAAAELIEEFNEAVEGAVEAYDPNITVMGLITSGNEVRYSSAEEGRGASDFFNLVGMTPAMSAEGSENHQGDDISIEAIAEAQADFFLVLDRDAAVTGEEPTSPAIELIKGSAALANVPAVQNDAIYIMPDDYYLTEDIFAYITVLNGLAKSFKAL